MQSSFVGPTAASILRPDPVEAGGKDEEGAEDDQSLAALLADPVLRTNLIASCFTWLFASFNFYLITFYLKYFPGNIYINSLCFALSDAMAFTSSGMFLRFVTVSQGITLANIIGLSGGLLYLAFYKTASGYTIPIIVCISRLGGAMNFNIGYVSVARLFPTQF